MIHYQFSIGMFKCQFGKLKPLVPILVKKNKTKVDLIIRILKNYLKNPKLKYMSINNLLSILI